MLITTTVMVIAVLVMVTVRDMVLVMVIVVIVLVIMVIDRLFIAMFIYNTQTHANGHDIGTSRLVN